MRALIRIDRFYYFFGAVVIILAVIAIVSLRGIFSSLKVAGEIDESLLESSSPRIDKEKIELAIETVTSKEIKKLDLNR